MIQCSYEIIQKNWKRISNGPTKMFPTMVKNDGVHKRISPLEFLKIGVMWTITDSFIIIFLTITRYWFDEMTDYMVAHYHPYDWMGACANASFFYFVFPHFSFLTLFVFRYGLNQSECGIPSLVSSTYFSTHRHKNII